MSLFGAPIPAARRRILAVGPGEGFTTGQSVAFLAYVRKSRHSIFVVNTNDEGMSLLSHAASSVRVVILAAWRLLFHRPQCVYISTSRSRLGAIKDILVIALARLVKVPVVNHLHGITFASFRESLGTLYASIVDWAYGYIAASIVLHEKLLQQYSRYPNMKVLIVNNFVDEEVARSVRRKGAPVGRMNVLFMSNMIPEKGIFELVDAVKGILEERPGGIALKIAGRFLPGDGMSAREVEAKLYQSIAGCTEIEYCGFADARTKKALLEWAHVLSLPSYMKEEAIPLVVLEAMAAGCYLIVSDFGILPFLVKDLVAAVVPIKDAAALEKALESVAANPKLLANAALRNPLVAQERYSEAQFVSSVDDIVMEFSAERVR